MSGIVSLSTGLNGLDKILHYLRLGDNVVWQVEYVEDYSYFARQFVEYNLQQNKRIVYLRFGQHEKILPFYSGIKMYQLDANRGFEAFSSEVHRIVSVEGEKVLYVFDCLSDLLTSWATDLMIGNFFKVTCPYLFELNTIAYFAILRDRNSYDTIVRIRETTQLLLDVYRDDTRFFVHPLKVWNRYSTTMFLPHVEIGPDFVPISNSIENAHLFSTFQAHGPGNAGRKLDYWDRTFFKAQELEEKLQSGKIIDDLEKDEMFEKLCKMMIGRDDRIISLARKYFDFHDLLEIRNRLISSGFIGGKAVGMLLARKILFCVPDRDWASLMEPHDSFYVGSDAYYTYLVENDCWKLRLEQKQREKYFTAAAELRQHILEGSFPVAVQEQFYQMLEYYGQSPIIVRSSSLLEDGFANAFAGKYESVFCVNQGTLQERYDSFEQAVKKIYASSMGEDALVYRLQRGMADSDEQMALLVQRVSGSYHQQFFFPDLAGVAMSRNPYIWRDDLDNRAGMMRMVLGLGTRAVNREGDDYPRLVALDKPLLRPDSRLEDIQKFSQHQIDLLDSEINDWNNLDFKDIYHLKEGILCWELLAVKDYRRERLLRKAGYENTESWVLTFDALFSAMPLAKTMSEILQSLEEAYSYPVEIEFTINFFRDAKISLNILQCRPLQMLKKIENKIESSISDPDSIFFCTKGKFMGSQISGPLNKIVYIYPPAYINLSIQDKYEIARLVGKLNRIFKKDKNQNFILIGPGRWGSSIPSLGVPVSFAEISNTAVLVEEAVKNEGYMPDLSFGTHFFQDLVEMQIFYVALFPDENEVIFKRELLMQEANVLGELLPEASKWSEVVKVIDLEKNNQRLFMDIDLQNREVLAYLEGL